jgi:ParB-like chromosome segregation protein Spo0J
MTAKAKTPKAPAPVAPMTIRRVRLDDLRPDPANPRTHGARNLAALEGSFAEFAQVEPLIVQAGTLRVIAGHGRIEVMRARGDAECDVRELDVTDRQARRLAVLLNRSAELAGWDDPALIEVLQAIRDEDGLEMLAATGFGEDELAALMKPWEPTGDPDGKEYDESAADGVETCTCPQCGFTFPK